MRGLVIVSRDDHGVAHDGSAGVSPEGWLPDRVSVGALTRAFPPEVVDRVVATTDTREIRRRLLPARLVVYFVLALWLFRGPNCGYGRVMVKLVEALYHRRRGQQLLDGVLDPDGWVDAGEGRRWRPPNISSLSRARTRLGADPLHMLFEQVAGPVGAPDAAGVFCCGLRVVSMDGSSTDVPDTKENDEYFGRPSNATRAGAFPQVRWVVAAESGTGALIGAAIGAYTVGEQTLARDLLGAFGPGMLVLADRNFLSHTLARDVLATGAHILWRAPAAFALTPTPVLPHGRHLAPRHPPRRPRRRRLPRPAAPRTPQRRPADHRAGHRVHRAHHRPGRRRAVLGAVLPGHRPARPRGLPGAGSGVRLRDAVGSRDRDRPPQDRHGRRPAGAAQQRSRGRGPGDVGPVRGLPGHPHPDRSRRRRRWHPTREDQLPARPGRGDRLGHRELSPLTSLTWPWPPSCSRSSTRACSSATAPTEPVHEPRRRPATSPPAKINPASYTSPGDYRSTASDPTAPC